MEKIEKLRENIFVEIGKLITMAQLKSELDWDKKESAEEESALATIQSVKDKLKKHCQRWPHSKYCKEKNKSK